MPTAPQFEQPRNFCAIPIYPLEGTKLVTKTITGIVDSDGVSLRGRAMRKQSGRGRRPCFESIRLTATPGPCATEVAFSSIRQAFYS